MDTNKQGACSSCVYWEHQPAAKIEAPTKINGAARTFIETGLCHFAPPVSMQVMTQGTLGQTQVQMVRVLFPNMQAGEFCAQHPDRVIQREYMSERARVRARNETVEYDPAKHPDTGFNVPPSLAAAKRIAMVADGSKTDA